MSEEEIIDKVMMIDQWKVSGDIYTQDELNAIGELIDLYNKEKEKNKKIEETVRKGMKNLWIDSCAEDSGKYSAYISILNILEDRED